MGSVIGGATYSESTKTEGLTREQVMKIVQKHQGQIQQCYERSLMDDANLAGRAEFEWEISAQGSVTSVSVKESNLRNGEKLLDCVKGVFKKMAFPSAKNGASTTPTIGLPFGRL
ncbi:MAG: AgmX/PglI C-terminal domain-containing protein [Bdellovibrionales bacterium]|nr:AgmX/PglI C-terminal domain-containing protein [Bdellovibrionales bacterium]